MLARIVVIALAFLLGVWVGGPITSPYCPTEDSCTPDYYNGQWHIKEDTP